MTGGHCHRQVKVKNQRRPNAKEIEKKYECLFCQRRFPRYQNLEQHIVIHTEERPFICSECGICMKTSAEKRDHFRVVHLGIKWQCPVCGQEFNALSNMCNHRKRMHKNWKVKKKPNVVNVKNKSKPKTDDENSPKIKTKLVNNIKLKSKSIASSKVKINEQVVKLNKSSKKSNAKATFSLSRRGATTTGRPKKFYKCDLCNKVFFATDKGSLNRHKQHVHFEGPPPKPLPKKPVKFWKCDICAKIFRCYDRHSLFRHKASVHNLSQKILNQTIDQEENLPFLYLPPPSPPKQEGPLSINDTDIKYPSILPISSFDEMPPPDFHFHPPFKLINFSALLPPRKNVDPSFFLHMNRYIPEEEEQQPEVTFSKISPLEAVVKQESQENDPFVIMPTIKIEPVDRAASPSSPPPLPPLKQETGEIIDTTTTLIKKELKPSKVINPSSRDWRKPKKCEKCGNILANLKGYQRHQQIEDCVLRKRRLETPVSSFWFSCHFCHKDFGVRRHHLLRHIVAIHRYPNEEDEDESAAASDQDEKSSCAFCGLKFPSRQTTQQHILFNHNALLGVPRE